MIADSGKTGNQIEIHLHFEARDYCDPDNAFSGQSIPALAIMGNWWNHWCAPPPFLTAEPTKENSGRAEYPVNATAPTETWLSSPEPLCWLHLQFELI